MKKLSLYIFLVLMFSNVANAATPQGVYHIYIIVKDFILEHGFTFSLQALFIYIVIFWAVVVLFMSSENGLIKKINVYNIWNRT